MNLDWSMILMVGGWVLSIAAFFFALWLKNDRDLAKTKEAVAKMIGDALALAAAFADAQMISVTDAQLDAFSGGVYDVWVPRLPDGLPGLVLALYPKEQFQVLFRRVWREYSVRKPELKMIAARQL